MIIHFNSRMAGKKILTFLLLITVLSAAAIGQNKRKKAVSGKNSSRNPELATASGLIANWAQAQQAAKPVVEEKANGSINWTEQFIEAKGQAAIDNEKFKNAAQARLMAQRGAVVVAQRNLLEIIKGVNVTGETTVEDMITSKDYIISRVDGVIKGAQMVGEPMLKDGFVEVRMRVSIYEGTGLAQAVYDELPDSSASPAPDAQPSGKVVEKEENKAVSKTDTASAQEPVVFSISNPKDWNPSMFPIVTDENGNVVLDLSKIYDPSKGKFPKILGLTKEIFDAAGWKKGASAIDAVANKDGKLVIPNSQKSKINWKKVLNTMATVGRFVLKLI